MFAIYGVIVTIRILCILLLRKLYKAFCPFIPDSVLLPIFLAFRNPDDDSSVFIITTFWLGAYHCFCHFPEIFVLKYYFLSWLFFSLKAKRAGHSCLLRSSSKSCSSASAWYSYSTSRSYPLLHSLSVPSMTVPLPAPTLGHKTVDPAVNRCKCHISFTSGMSGFHKEWKCGRLEHSSLAGWWLHLNKWIGC